VQRWTEFCPLLISSRHGSHRKHSVQLLHY
jgi:hypothetical protein